MPFDDTTCTTLQYYASNPPPTERDWYGPWNAILTTLFPAFQGYIVYPKHRDDPTSQDCDFTAEVVNHNQSQPNRQTGAPFRGTAYPKSYWIEVIGPHWRYGEKDYDEPGMRPLIDWHHTMHDQASFDDFQALARLVADLG